MLIPVAVGLISVLVIAGLLGKKYKSIIGDIKLASIGETEQKVNEEKQNHCRPKLFPVNILLIIAAIATMISSKLPPHVVFMLAFCIALVINYPNVKDQRQRVDLREEDGIEYTINMSLIIVYSEVIGAISIVSTLDDAYSLYKAIDKYKIKVRNLENRIKVIQRAKYNLDDIISVDIRSKVVYICYSSICNINIFYNFKLIYYQYTIIKRIKKCSYPAIYFHFISLK